MSQIAICIGGIVIYWSSIVIALGVAVCCTMTYALYTAHGGKIKGLAVMYPMAIVFSVIISRLVHWYCHSEQYTSIFSALFDYSAGDYCLCGVFMGVILAVLLVKKLRYIDDAGKLFDALVPGSILGIALIRLSALFNTSCRSKIVVTNEAYQRLPFASAIPVSDGSVEYRFATFFVEAMILMLLFLVMLRMYYKRRDWPMKGGTRASGHVGLLFLAFYSALIVISDSTRYDSSYLPINGFVSFVQVLGGVCLFGIMIYYTVCSVKANGFSWKQIVLWVLFVAGVGGTGYLEYLVQRHGDWYLMCYSAMSGTCFLMALCIYLMYRTVCHSRKEVKAMKAMAQMQAPATEKVYATV